MSNDKLYFQSWMANNEVTQVNLCECLKFHNVVLEIGYWGSVPLLRFTVYLLAI